MVDLGISRVYAIEQVLCPVVYDNLSRLVGSAKSMRHLHLRHTLQMERKKSVNKQMVLFFSKLTPTPSLCMQ